MMSTIGKVLRGWFMGPGNEFYDAGRFLWFISVVAGIAYSGTNLFVNKAFSIIEFGAGMGALLAAGGFGVATKDKGAASAANTTPPSPPKGGQP